MVTRNPVNSPVEGKVVESSHCLQGGELLKCWVSPTNSMGKLLLEMITTLGCEMGVNYHHLKKCPQGFFFAPSFTNGWWWFSRRRLVRLWTWMSIHEFGEVIDLEKRRWCAVNGFRRFGEIFRKVWLMTNGCRVSNWYVYKLQIDSTLFGKKRSFVNIWSFLYHFCLNGFILTLLSV